MDPESTYLPLEWCRLGEAHLPSRPPLKTEMAVAGVVQLGEAHLPGRKPHCQVYLVSNSPKVTHFWLGAAFL